MAETGGDARLSGGPSQNKVLVLANASVTPRIAKKGQLRPAFTGELDTTLAQLVSRREDRPGDNSASLTICGPISITFHMDVDLPERERLHLPDLLRENLGSEVRSY